MPGNFRAAQHVTTGVIAASLLICSRFALAAPTADVLDLFYERRFSLPLGKSF